jgi:DNA polymerase
MESINERLEELQRECEVCKDCILNIHRHGVVFSDGVPNNKLVLVGEAPGYWEDIAGKPFVGKSGQLLDKIFQSVSLSRQKDIYICNTVKCRPPDNRNPTGEEQLACKKYLYGQLDILRPQLIILCGAIAVKNMLGASCGITKVRGKWFDGPFGSRMMPIFHPAYLLRNPSSAKGGPKWLMWQDFQEIKKAYDCLVS